MHLPDGFLSVPVSTGLLLASSGAVAAAVKRSSPAGEEPSGAAALPLMAVLSAFLFAAQMFNFPIAAGTTGHLLGAALATALVGPWRGLMVVTVVLLIQAFGFADGGVLALGANVFNMAVAGCLVSGLVLAATRKLAGGRQWWSLAGLAVAAWLSVMAAAGLTAVELALSGTVPARIVLPAMLSVHALIGLGEAALTVTAYSLVAGRRPDLVAAARDGGLRGAEMWRLAAVLGLGLVVVRLAVPNPDGLERVAEALGFAGRAAAGFSAAPLPDYALPGAAVAGFDWLGSYLSAGVGMAVCGLLMFAVGAGLRRPAPVPVRADDHPS